MESDRGKEQVEKSTRFMVKYIWSKYQNEKYNHFISVKNQDKEIILSQTGILLPAYKIQN